MKRFWELLNEVSPPGFAPSIRAAFLHHPDIFGSPDHPGKLNAYAIFWSMHKKGAKSKYTGTDSSLEGKPKKKKSEKKKKKKTFKEWLEVVDVRSPGYVLTVGYNNSKYHIPDPEDALDDFGSTYNSKQEIYPDIQQAIAAFRNYIEEVRTKLIKKMSGPRAFEPQIYHLSITERVPDNNRFGIPHSNDLAWWNRPSSGGDLGEIKFGPGARRYPALASLKMPSIMDVRGAAMFDRFRGAQINSEAPTQITRGARIEPPTQVG